MKKVLYLSLSVLIVVLLVRGILSQTVPKERTFIYAISQDKAIIIQGRVAGDLKAWLSVETYNGHEWKDNGFDPSYTHVISSYKPMFRKLPSGQWEILFTSEIAENIP